MIVQKGIMKQCIKQASVVSTLGEFTIRSRISRNPKEVTKWLSRRLEMLGPTYIKLGQFISSRKDIFGKDIVSELEFLKDNVKPIDELTISHILKNIENESKIKHIVKKPFATASIGQVHMGELVDGTRVVIKIKRPNIEEEVTTDISFLKSLVNVLSLLRIENFQNLSKILDDVETLMTQETDFEKEKNGLQQFFALYNNPDVKIPRVYDSLSNDQYIVMEYIENTGLTFQNNADAKDFARKLMIFFINQLLEVGIIHGDPHTGNIGKSYNGKIVIYDLGNIIELNEEERFIIKELVYMLVLKNKYGVAKLLPTLGITITDENELYKYIDKYVEYMETIDYRKLTDLYDPSNHTMPIKLEGKVLRIIRAFGTLEGICKELDPSFNYFKLIDLYITNALADEEFLVYKINKDSRKLESFIYKIFGNV